MMTKQKPSNIGPWKQFRNLNIYANPLGEIKYKMGKSEYLFKKWEYKNGNHNIVPNMVITPKNKRFFVKRVVWEAFNGPVPKGYGIIHKNGLNRCDELQNLQLVKVSDYCKIRGANKHTRYVIDLTNRKKYRGSTEAAKYLNLSRSSVGRYCNGKIKNPMYNLKWGKLVSGDDL